MKKLKLIIAAVLILSGIVYGQGTVIDTTFYSKSLGTTPFVNPELNGRFEDYIVFDLLDFIDTNYKILATRDKLKYLPGMVGAALRYEDQTLLL